MTGVAWFDGITVIAEVALATAGGPYAQWDDALTGWDVGQWGPDRTWVDLSDRLRRWSTSGAFREDGTWGSGKGRLDLTNQDGHLSGDNPSSPYVVGGLSSMQPWRDARIRIGYGGALYDIEQLLTEPWEDASPSPAPAGGGAGLVSAPLQDEWARLALAPTPGVAAEGAGDLFGPRLHRILDAAGHRGPRDIESGTVTMQATTLTTAVQRELQLTADSEGGWVWPYRGTIMGRGRRTLVESPRSTTVQATFTDTPSADIDVPYTAYRKRPPGSNRITGALYTRVGGTAQSYRDTSAAALVGGGGLWAKRTDLICETDTQALGLATWHVSLRSTATDAITSVTAAPRANGCNRLPLLLGLQHLDLVQHVRHAPGGYTVTRNCHITGIAHDWDVRGRWRITFTLTDATVPLLYASSLWDVGLWGSSPADRSPGVCLWFPS